MNYIINRSMKRSMNFQSIGYSITVEGENLIDVLTAIESWEKNEKEKIITGLNSFKVVIDSKPKSIIDDGNSTYISETTYKIASKACNNCGKAISWQYTKHDKLNPNPLISKPWHIDKNGFLIDDGKCKGG